MNQRRQPTPSDDDGSDEIDPTAAPSRRSLPGLGTRALPPPGPARRLALGRMAGGLLVAIGVAWGLYAGGRWTFRSLHEWLAEQPAYTLTFDQIRLEPAPPPWIASGAAGLLERVRIGAGHDEPLSALDLDADRLSDDFRRESPWVRGVEQIEVQTPNRVIVRLAYREPVATLKVGKSVLVLDRDAVVLPGNDLDISAAGPLIALDQFLPDHTTAADLHALPGRRLTVEGVDSARNDLIAGAARLADDFRRLAVAAPPRCPVEVRMIQPDPNQREHPGELFVQTYRKTLIHWGLPPSAETSDQPETKLRWDLLLEWFDDQARESSLDRVLGRLAYPPPRGELMASYLELRRGKVELRTVPYRPSP